MTPSRLGHSNLGLGLGLRTVHFPYILEHYPRVDWFEIISENFMDSGGRPRYVLEQVAERYAVVMHGVSLSIGSTDPLNFEYRYLRSCCTASRCPSAAPIRSISTTSPSSNGWPTASSRAGFPTTSAGPAWPGSTPTTCCRSRSTKQTLAHVVARIRTVQDFLERPLVLENPSTYVTFADSTMSEWEFLSRMAEETDCGLLLDVNNVYVSSVNHDFDPAEYLRSVPHRRVVQFHLAGHTELRHAPDRHPRRPRDRPGLGAVPAGPPPDRRRIDAAGMGRQDSPVPGRPRRGEEGP